MNSINRASLVTSVILLLSYAPAQAQEVLLENAVVISHPISASTMTPVMNHMSGLITNPAGVPKEVHLIINSPGGSVQAGMRFISLMHALQGSGTKFVCFVPYIAASMAFQILVNCDTRYTLNEAGLLWHRARIMMGGQGAQPITAPELLRYGKELLDMDNSILSGVSSVLARDLGKEEVLYHFDSETLHQGQLLAARASSFVTSKKHIPGLFSVLYNEKAVRTANPSISVFDLFKQGEMIYIKQDR